MGVIDHFTLFASSSTPLSGSLCPTLTNCRWINSLPLGLSSDFLRRHSGTRGVRTRSQRRETRDNRRGSGLYNFSPLAISWEPGRRGTKSQQRSYGRAGPLKGDCFSGAFVGSLSTHTCLTYVSSRRTNGCSVPFLSITHPSCFRKITTASRSQIWLTESRATETSATA